MPKCSPFDGDSEGVDGESSNHVAHRIAMLAEGAKDQPSQSSHLAVIEDRQSSNAEDIVAMPLESSIMILTIPFLGSGTPPMIENGTIGFWLSRGTMHAQ
jgi:hypothetical protein